MKTEFTEQKIQHLLSYNFFVPASIKYDLDGLYVFAWESDKLLFTKSGYAYEFEIKISRADFKNDFKHKVDKHLILDDVYSGEHHLPRFFEFHDANTKLFPDINVWEIHCKRHCPWYFTDYYKRPNYFYYAVPEGLVSDSEVPRYAGLVYILDDGTISTIKKAPRLHDRKYTDAELKLGEKFYYNMASWRRTAWEWRKMFEDKCRYIQMELSGKGQDMTYQEMKIEKEKAEKQAKVFKELALANERLYMVMVEGADYNEIERHRLIEIIKKHDPGFDYLAFMKEIDKEYDERYPERKARDEKAVSVIPK